MIKYNYSNILVILCVLYVGVIYNSKEANGQWTPEAKETAITCPYGDYGTRSTNDYYSHMCSSHKEYCQNSGGYTTGVGSSESDIAQLFAPMFQGFGEAIAKSLFGDETQRQQEAQAEAIRRQQELIERRMQAIEQESVWQNVRLRRIRDRVSGFWESMDAAEQLQKKEDATRQNGLRTASRKGILNTNETVILRVDSSAKKINQLPSLPENTRQSMQKQIESLKEQLGELKEQYRQWQEESKPTMEIIAQELIRSQNAMIEHKRIQDDYQANCPGQNTPECIQRQENIQKERAKVQQEYLKVDVKRQDMLAKQEAFKRKYEDLSVKLEQLEKQLGGS